MDKMKFKRVEAGLYRNEMGYEVQRDATGYVTIEAREGDGIACGCDDDGWSLALGDDVLDWYDTKREAVAAANKHYEATMRQINGF
jgi:hypothetical protein